MIVIPNSQSPPFLIKSSATSLNSSITKDGEVDEEPSMQTQVGHIAVSIIEGDDT